jgi:hypothetical protein
VSVSTVVGRQSPALERENFVFRWPGNEEPGGRLIRTNENNRRFDLRWPTNHPPAPWRVALNINVNSLETFEGNPHYKTPEEANSQWEDYKQLHREPWLVVVKLKGELGALHLRAYLGNPPSHLEHCSTDNLPPAILEAMGRQGIGACRAVSFPTSSQHVDGVSNVHIWFDPERNHDAFCKEPARNSSSVYVEPPFTPISPQDPMPRDVAESQDSFDSHEEINDELSSMEARLSRPPTLTEGLQPREYRQQSRPRDVAFRLEIRRAYSARCAVCGDALSTPDGNPEVEAAHIYPKSLDGSDDLRNGIALCRRHHWALDVGWMAFDDDLRVIIRSELPDDQSYEFIRRYEGEQLEKPGDARLIPLPLFLRQHRILHGFEPKD